MTLFLQVTMRIFITVQYNFISQPMNMIIPHKHDMSQKILNVSIKVIKKLIPYSTICFLWQLIFSITLKNRYISLTCSCFFQKYFNLHKFKLLKKPIQCLFMSGFLSGCSALLVLTFFHRGLGKSIHKSNIYVHLYLNL